jgi:PKD repeat protein
MRSRPLPSLLVATLALTACHEPGTNPPHALRSAAQAAVRVEGYLTRGEVRSGYVFGRDGSPKAITYEVHHGLAVWEGDIILGKASEIATTRETLLARGPNLGVVIDGDAMRWPGGIVPYEIDGGLPNQSRATDAMTQVEQETNGVHFVPRTSEANYIRFVSSDGCSSEIGMIGGAQNINLADGCSTGNTMHEIGHALGMYHEHTRCDRDTYVQINWDNIEDGKSHNFDKQCDGATDLFDYAEGSIMHYSPFAFSKNDLPTIVSLRDPPLDDLMGQRSAYGPTDIATINELYGAHNDAPTAAIGALASSYNEAASVAFSGSGTDPDDATLTYSWDFGDGTCSVPTPPAACTQMNPSHVYVDNGSYSVVLTVSDGYATGNAATTAIIVNVAPTVNAGGDVSLVSGQTLNFSGTFSDPGIIDYPWSWTIDWGFGSNAAGSTNNQAAAIVASTQVCAAGTYNVVLSVTDKDGGVGSDSRTLTVPHFGITIDISPTLTSPNPISLAKKGLLPVAIMSSATFDATTVDPSTVYLGNEAGADTPVALQANGRYHTKIEDVNGDGLADLIVMFQITALLANGDLEPATTELVLRGFQGDGCLNFRGTDAVKVVSS